MKTYRKPLSKIVKLDNEQLLNNGSPGVDNGSTLGNVPVTNGAFYSKGLGGHIIDDDEEDF